MISLSEKLGWRLLVLGILLAPGFRLLSIEWQLGLALPIVTFFGLPHGAADWWVAEAIWRGRRWHLWFVLSYLAVAGLAVFLILLFPCLSLLAFLGISIWHFGAEDSEACGLESNGLACLCYGIPPVVGAALSWPETTTWVLKAMGGLPSGFEADTVWQIALGVLVLWSVSYIIVWTRQRPALVAMAQPVAIWGLFWACPPIIAFTIYMTAVHAPRHVRALDVWLTKRGAARGKEPILLAISLISALLVTGIAAMAWQLSAFDTLSSAAVAALFWGLAALTFPHILLSALAERKAEMGRKG